MQASATVAVIGSLVLRVPSVPKTLNKRTSFVRRRSSSVYISDSRLTSFSLILYFRLGDFAHIVLFISSYIDFAH